MIQILNTVPATAVVKSSRQQTPEFELVRYVSKFMHITEAEAMAIMENITFKTFKKGHILLKEGQVSNLCYFNLKGCVRQYYLIDGEEKTTNFYTEGQPIAPNEGVFKTMPSKFYLSCVEDCILTIGTPEDEAKFFEKLPQLESVVRVAVENELGKTQHNFADFMLSSPEERYLNLIKNRPELIDRVPQYQLASYLGIKPESLSRIRKRIMQK